MLLGIENGPLSAREDGLSSVTKLGGRPVYMKPLKGPNLALVESLTHCQVCGGPMHLVCQAFAPWNDEYNRMLYLFCCNTTSCGAQLEHSWSCFTVQHDEEDVSAFAEDEEDEKQPAKRDGGGVAALRRGDVPPFTFPPLAVDIIDEPLEGTRREGSGPNLPEEEEKLLEKVRSQIRSNNKGELIPKEDLEELEEAIDHTQPKQIGRRQLRQVRKANVARPEAGPSLQHRWGRSVVHECRESRAAPGSAVPAV